MAETKKKTTKSGSKTTKTKTTKTKAVEKEIVNAAEKPIEAAGEAQAVETANVSPEAKASVREPEITQSQYNAEIADLKQMVASLQAQLAEKNAQQVQVVQVAPDAEKVHFLFMAEVADDNVYNVGPSGMYGRVVGKTGNFFVPKNELSRVSDPMFRLLLDRRWIVVVDGLDAEEREMWGVNYKEGEVLDRKAFAKMLDIYPALCPDHKEMVAKRYADAYAAGNRKLVKRETVVALNKLSDKDSKAQKAFAEIIEKMNEEDAR